MNNSAMGVSAAIAGGANNSAQGASVAIGGGSYNTAGGAYATIAGGIFNYASGDRTVIAGSYNNATAFAATVGGGNYSTASGYGSTVAGGESNHAEGGTTFGGGHATVGGGYANYATNSFSTVVGGALNLAGGQYSLAAGRRAQAVHDGAFVYADSTAADFASTGNNQFAVRASGGYRLVSNAGQTAGVSLPPGGTSWAVISDRNVKKDFAAVDGVAVLEKLAAIPVTQWHYQWEEAGSTPHIGPMAQDFKAAFYPGADDKNITTLEADGVTFAAIQGLNSKLEATRAENSALRKELREIKELLKSALDSRSKE